MVVISGTKWSKVGVMSMLMGEYHHNIDDKGRLVIPAKFRYELGEKFIVTRGLDKCLFVYSIDNWNEMVKKFQQLPFTNKDARNFMRFLLSGATECEFDKQSRVKISNPLIDYATLERECIIIGVNDRLEIWSESKWNEFISTNEESLSDIAENLFAISTIN